MAGFADALKRYAADKTAKLDTVVSETVREFGDQLVREYTPYGDPTLWKSAPPADYRPGNLRSSWFYSEGRPSGATTDAVNILTVNNLDAMPKDAAGRRHFLSNSAPHATAIEKGHSSQSPAGLLVNSQEFPYIAKQVAQRVFK